MEDYIEVHIVSKYAGYAAAVVLIFPIFVIAINSNNESLVTLFFFLVSVLLVMWLGHMLLSFREKCMVSEEGLYMEHFLFPERISYDSIIEINMNTKRKGLNGPGFVKINYRKTWVDGWGTGQLPLVMRVKDRKKVFDLLKSKCPTLKIR